MSLHCGNYVANLMRKDKPVINTKTFEYKGSHYTISYENNIPYRLVILDSDQCPISYEPILDKGVDKLHDTLIEYASTFKYDKF